MPKVGTVRVSFDADSKNLMIEINKAVGELKKFGKRANAEANRIKYAFNKIRRAAQVVASAFIMTHAIKRLGDLVVGLKEAEEQATLMKLRLSTFGQEIDTFARLYNLSQKLGQGLQDTAQIMTRLQVATRSIGTSQDEIEKVVENLFILGKVGGASMEEMRGGMIQLSQGLASGRLQGEELRSVLENMPLVAIEIAKELGSDIGLIRQFAAEGKITSDVIISALTSIEHKFEDLPDTFSQQVNRMKNEWMLFKAVIAGKFSTSIGTTYVMKTLRRWREEMGDFSHYTKEQLDFALSLQPGVVDSLKAQLDEAKDKLDSFGPDAEINPFLPEAREVKEAKRVYEDLVEAYEDAVFRLNALSLNREALFGKPLTEDEQEKINRLREQEQIYAAIAEDLKIPISRVQQFREEFKKLGESAVDEIRTTIAFVNALRDAEVELKGTGLSASAAEEALAILNKQLKEAELSEAYEQAKAQFEGIAFTLDQFKRESASGLLGKKLDVAQLMGFASVNEVDAFIGDIVKNIQSLEEKGESASATMRKFFDSVAGQELLEHLDISGDALERLLENMDYAAELGLDAGMNFADFAAEIKKTAIGTEEFEKRLYQLALRLAEAGEYGLTKENVEEWWRNLQDAGKQMDQFAIQAARNIQSAFADFLFDPFEDGLRGMLKNFIDTIRRMVAEVAAHWFLLAIFKEGTWLGDALRTPGRAIGGPVSGGTPYLVGEKGPELFVPGASGTIVPAHRLQSGGITVIQNNNVDARGATQDVIRMLPSILAQNNAQLTAQLRDNLRRTGGL